MRLHTARLEAIMPVWAVLRRMDPAKPLSEQVGNAKVLIPTTGVVDRASIEAAHDLRLIAQPAAGYNNIDIEAAQRRRVPVTIAPGCNSQAVAESALLMILMLMRRIDEARQAFQRMVIGEPVGRELYCKVLGIVGLGRVGSCLAAAAQGLGMKVLSVNSKSGREELEALLRGSDIVSLHCPLTPATTGLIGPTELSLMKPEAVLINCARGGVIDKTALLECLASGRLSGVGLDVHWLEPAPPGDPLYQHPRVLALPHLGSITEEVYDRFAKVLCENIVAVREGRPLLHQLC